VLKVEGSRKRGLIEYSGEKKILLIRRLRCCECNRIHHELPDIIVPYKRYSSEAIENIISNKPEHPDASPCELSTVKRLKLWFCLLQKYYESILKSIEILHHYDKEIGDVISSLVPLSNYRTFPSGWLKILVRLVVNSNRWLQTRFA
jgi:hypothetical protein